MRKINKLRDANAGLELERRKLQKIIDGLIPHTKLQAENTRLREERALLWAAVTMLSPDDIQRVASHVLKLRTLPPPESIVADELEANAKRRDALAAEGDGEE